MVRYFVIQERKWDMSKKNKKLLLLPIVFMMSAVPLIVYMYEYNSNLSQFHWYSATEQETDFFLYYKAMAIIAVAAVMCVALIGQYLKQKKEFRFDSLFIPLLVYALLTLFSSVFSEYRYFCFHGIAEMFESVWVLLGYCIIAFYTYQFVRTQDDVMFILKWFTVGVAVMLFIGVTQASGHDFYATKLGKMLITVKRQWTNLDGIGFTFEKGRVYLSVYNPNYVASYFSLVIPVLVALLVKSKKIALKVLYACFIIASVVCLLAAGNRSGVVVFAAAGVFSLILFRRQILQHWKIVAPAAGAVLLVAVVVLANHNQIIGKFMRLFHAEVTEEDAISEILTGDDSVTITYRGNALDIAYDYQEDTVSVSLTDGEGNPVACDLNAETVTYNVTDERFPDFAVTLIQMPDNNIGMDVFADNMDWYFEKGSDGTYYYYNTLGRLDKINNAPKVAVGFMERAFDARGTIWSKTIPLLKDCLLFGTGADTYTLVYPQNDYVAKKYDGTENLIDVKPHCFYLQVAVQSGVPALIAMLAFYIWYFIRCAKIYWRASYKEPMEMIGVSLWIATSAYMVASVMNDSSVNVSPVYWVMMGLGIAVNEMVRTQETDAGSVDAAK